MDPSDTNPDPLHIANPRSVLDQLQTYALDFLNSIRGNETLQGWFGHIQNYFPDALMDSDLQSMVYYLLVILSVSFICNNIVNYFRAWNGDVKLNWESSPRLGHTASFKILFFPPPPPESIADTLLQRLSIKICHEGVDEVVCNILADPNDHMISVNFNVEKSGKYEICVRYNGFPVGETPLTFSVDPDRMDLSKTVLSLQSPIVATKGKTLRLDIIPFDQFGNRCSASTDDLMRLSLEVGKLGQNEAENNPDIQAQILDEILTSFGLRRDTVVLDEVITVITFYLKPEVEGVYYITILYNGEPLPTSNSSKLEVVSLSEDEDVLVVLNEIENKKALSTTTFSAVWIRDDPIVPEVDEEDERNENEDDGDFFQQHITIELSPRYIFFKGKSQQASPLASTVKTFRVSPQTKVTIVDSMRNGDDDVRATAKYVLEISDPESSKCSTICMPQADARVFFALVTKFKMTIEDGSLLSFESKRDLFYRQLRDQYPTHWNRRSNFRPLKIRRDYDVESTMQATMAFTATDWRKLFVISFYGEPPASRNLAWLEWSKPVLNKLMEFNSFGLFHSLGTSRFIHPNPTRHPRWNVEYFELAGKIIGKYMYESALATDQDNRRFFVEARFTRSFLAQILSLQPNYKHLQLDAPTGVVEPILNDDNVSDKNLRFVGPTYDKFGNVTGLRNLIPNGNEIQVTNSNKIMYLNEMAKLRLKDDVEQEIKAFVTGLQMLIPKELLMNFNENELELLMCGYSNFDIKEFQRYSSFGNESMEPQTSRIKGWLTECLQKMEPLDKGRFLQFITGSSRLPQGGLVELRPRIRISLSCVFGQIPTANKTSNQLVLSDHPNFQDFEAALMKAILSTCDEAE